ncbi:MAG TPA: phage tail tip lysozyme [Candidatus Saccharimonadales bacterium]
MNALKVGPDQFIEPSPPEAITDEMMRYVVDLNLELRPYPTPLEETVARVGDSLRTDAATYGVSTIAMLGILGSFAGIGPKDASPAHSSDRVTQITSPDQSIESIARSSGVSVSSLDQANSGILPKVNLSNANAPLSPGLEVKIPKSGHVFGEKTATPPPQATSETISPATVEAAPTSNQIYVIGDSLTVGMNDAGLSGALTSNGWAVNKVDATVGYGVTSSIINVRNDTERIKAADTVVVELGTNDEYEAAPNGGPSIEFETKITNMIAAIRAINPTVNISWINIYSTKYPGYQSINKAIEKQSKVYGFKVIDWANEVTSNPALYQFDPELGVHEVTPNGYKTQVDFIASQIGNAPAPEAIPTTTTVPAPEAVPAPPAQPAQVAFNYVKAKYNLSDGGAAGVAGNGWFESGNDPERLEDSAPGSLTPASSLSPRVKASRSIGWGFFQETPSGPFIGWAIANKLDPDSVEAQVDYAMIGISSNAELLAQLRDSAITPEEAAKLVELGFERPSGANSPYIGDLSGYALSSLPARQGYARTLYGEYHAALAQAKIIQKGQAAAAAKAAAQAAQSTTTVPPHSVAPTANNLPRHSRTRRVSSSSHPTKVITPDRSRPTGHRTRPTGRSR